MCPSDIKYDKEKNVAWLSILFPFDIEFLFLTEDPEE